MKLQKILTLGVATAALFALSQFAIAQNQGSQIGSQAEAIPLRTELRGRAAATTRRSR